MKNKTCCFTGHREIPKEKSKIISIQVEKQIERLIASNILNFMCGGAIGFDILCGESVIKYKELFPEIRLILALPCKNQNKYFNADDNKKYNFLLANADHIIYTSETYFRGCMHKRNRYMVDNSAHMISYCIKNSGGSFYTKNYAKSRGLTIYDLNEFDDIF